MKLAISADWHIDKDNRLDDMKKTLDELVAKVIDINPAVFVFLGDAFKNWRPTPLEASVFRTAIMNIASRGIEVIILVGNHDYPESEEYEGMHCFTEFTEWHNYSGKKSGITILDSNYVYDWNGVEAIFIPHLPKDTLQGKTYEEMFLLALDNLLDMNPPKKNVILFSHLFASEAIVGANDMTVSSNRMVSAKAIAKRKVDIAFFGDIHKVQKIAPNYYYPGSIERIDFGERDDEKGFIVYDTDAEVVDFIGLNTRQMEDVIIDLINPGFVKTATQENTDTNKMEIKDPYGYIMDVFREKEKQLKHAIVRMKIVCSKEQKAKIDYRESDMVKILLDEIEVHNLKGISYEIVDSLSVRNAEINESLSPALAFQKWVKMQNYEENMEQRITLAGEEIIKK